MGTMIGLLFPLIRMSFRLFAAMLDMTVMVCSLGKIDPRLRRIF